MTKKRLKFTEKKQLTAIFCLKDIKYLHLLVGLIVIVKIPLYE